MARKQSSKQKQEKLWNEMEDHRNSEEYKAQKDGLSHLRLNVKCKSEGQKRLLKAIKEKEVIFCSGQAGTGKTYLACAQALKMLKDEGRFQKIIITKSVTPIPGEDLGFLPGDPNEKMDPFMWSFWANFEKIIGAAEVRRLRELGMIEVWPLAYIRGANVDNAIAIIDETQNIPKGTLKTILTRLGTDSKFIFLGDSDQCDSKNKFNSSLPFYMEHFSSFEPFGMVELTADDEVRNPLISMYLQKLKEVDEGIERINEEQRLQRRIAWEKRSKENT